jgi:hypothetical protein
MIAVAPEVDNFAGVAAREAGEHAEASRGIALGKALLVETIPHRREEGTTIEGQDATGESALREERLQQPNPDVLQGVVGGGAQPAREALDGRDVAEWVQADGFQQGGIFPEGLHQITQRDEPAKGAVDQGAE